MIGIFTALPEELAPLLAHASSPSPAGRDLWRAAIAGTEVVIGATGEGPARAESRARAGIRAFPLGAVIGVGIAGGLSPTLRPGEVIAAREVRDEAGGAWAADPDLLARATGRADRVGVVVSCARVCFTAAEKRALAGREPGADNAIVDLESSGWARAAAAAGVPFLAIRGVVDAAGDEFPDAVRSAWTENGVDRLAVVVRAILRPREIPALVRLRRRTRRAMEAIAGILPAVLRAET